MIFHRPFTVGLAADRRAVPLGDLPSRARCHVEGDEIAHIGDNDVWKHTPHLPVAHEAEQCSVALRPHPNPRERRRGPAGSGRQFSQPVGNGHSSITRCASSRASPPSSAVMIPSSSARARSSSSFHSASPSLRDPEVELPVRRVEAERRLRERRLKVDVPAAERAVRAAQEPDRVAPPERRQLQPTGPDPRAELDAPSSNGSRLPSAGAPVRVGDGRSRADPRHEARVAPVDDDRRHGHHHATVGDVAQEQRLPSAENLDSHG